MTRLNALEILLLLSAGAFILPALAGGRARAIAGTVISGMAMFGLMVYLSNTDGEVARITVPAGASVSVVRMADKRAGETAARGPEGIPLDPVQFERERAEIERLWQEAELERRMWHTGSVAGGVFIWLAVATAYLKLDVLTAGRYRNRLRLGAAAATLAGTVASAWAWMVPV